MEHKKCAICSRIIPALPQFISISGNEISTEESVALYSRDIGQDSRLCDPCWEKADRKLTKLYARGELQL